MRLAIGIRESILFPLSRTSRPVLEATLPTFYLGAVCMLSSVDLLALLKVDN